MKEDYRYFKRECLKFTQEQLDIISKQLFQQPYDSSFNVKWQIINFERLVTVRMGKAEVKLSTNMMHLVSAGKIRLNFGAALDDGTQPSDVELINRLSIHDVHRQLKWPIVHHYNGKILDLGQF